eukprot:scaffold298_cov65-Skeletonema_dohrnii-CCMP3373.AAC.2
MLGGGGGVTSNMKACGRERIRTVRKRKVGARQDGTGKDFAKSDVLNKSAARNLRGVSWNESFYESSCVE